MKTLTVKDETWKKLTMIKLMEKYSSIDEVINSNLPKITRRKNEFRK